MECEPRWASPHGPALATSVRMGSIAGDGAKVGREVMPGGLGPARTPPPRSPLREVEWPGAACWGPARGVLG